MRQKIASITHLLRLPAICALCDHYHTGRLAVCRACITLFMPLGAACQYCAHPLPDARLLICGHCCKQQPIIDRTLTAYRFEEPLRTLMHEFKYHEGLYLLTFLSMLMQQALPTEGYTTECLIPVPMHPKRIRQRGFNQAAELAKHLSQALKVPYDLSHCHKHVNTPPQAGLNQVARYRNLKGAFRVTPMSYQHVTLIDDLLTTGSTAKELADTLKQQGVRRVDLWCCARTIAPLI